MSKKQPMILVTPPLFPDEMPVEREKFGGILCNYCHGKGWFWGTDERLDRIKQTCPVCKGRKKLKAIVTIQWVPDDGNAD